MRPNVAFEISWEICNRIGGIHTVVKSKVPHMLSYIEEVVFIGPDIQHLQEKNGEFIEDTALFAKWKEFTIKNNIRIRTGRWNIKGKPKVILVDFTVLFIQKNQIFKKLWDDFKVNSISGNWNYIESVLFGYAAGIVIDSFYKYYLTDKKNILAHFHEWMTVAGVLYLTNNNPNIATVFTTHSTSLGRSICSNGQKLYSQLANINPINKAKELKIVSQNSLENIGVKQAHCFTTVSGITAKECEIILNKKVDFVCSNGLTEFKINKEAKQKAREKILSVLKAICGKVSTNAILIATSGRYEYRNKGIDLFISTLDKLKKEKTQKDIYGLILVPAHNIGVNKKLKEKLEGKNNDNLEGLLSTHQLHNYNEDTIIRSLQYYNFKNDANSKVRVLFVPEYLNGNDGIFNIPYYELFSGFDITMFASYYEPWGYTAHESIALGIPTITSTLAGFGIWAKENIKDDTNNGVVIVERNDKNYNGAANYLANYINNLDLQKLTTSFANNAYELSKKASWNVFFKNYKEAYAFALNKIDEERTVKVRKTSNHKYDIRRNNIMTNTPKWKKIIINYNLPENLKFLDELSKNLWWNWNHGAKKLFRMINVPLWEKCNCNPVALLKAVSVDTYNELQKNPSFLKRLTTVKRQYDDYMVKKPKEDAPKIAYFSMEFGLTDIIKIYSGGLGILAGDYLKEASDSNIKIIAVGLLYRYGYFTQRLSIHGDQLVDMVPQTFSELPLEYVFNKEGKHLIFNIEFPGRNVKVRVWKVLVGRVNLYLLDTDTNLNNTEDRSITHQLYGGNWENRLKQEFLLGIGGVRLFQHLNVEPDVYHINEGHAAFLNLERITSLIKNNNFSFDQAIEIVRASSLFTTHTPVPAGHDVFSEDLLRPYLRHIPELLNISWDTFLGLGRFNPLNKKEKFSMSIFAAKTSQEINGVSKLHGKITREMFTDLWKGYAANELHIGYVTNGVHYDTWISHEWKQFHLKTFGEQYMKDISNPEYWKNMYNVSNNDIWDVRNKLRKRLIDYLKNRFHAAMIKRQEDPKILVEILDKLDDKSLIIGFARRFATYKRAHLLFTDLNRLSEIVNNKQMPIRFIFSGKAHPHDKAGQDLIKNIIHISRRKEFIGKILYLENYDMQLAKRLVTGVDVWFNTPTRPLEASGTSGQKATLNGVLNYSVLDGWWVEGYKLGAGWALPQEKSFDNQHFQNQLDAATIYSMFENEIIPLFYNRDSENIPNKWIGYIKKSFAEIAPKFTTKRMIDDYNDLYYTTLYERTKKLKQDNFEVVLDITNWKRKIHRHWNDIEIKNIHFPYTQGKPYIIGETYQGTVVLDLKNLSKDDIGVEMVFSLNKRDFKKQIFSKYELFPVKQVGSQVYYKVEFELKKSGVYDWGLRIFPKNSNLPHRQDFPYVRWI